MDDNNNVKYVEEEYVFGDENNLNESKNELNKSKEEDINNKKLSENDLNSDEYKLYDDFEDKNDIKNQNKKESDENNYNDSKLFEDNYIDFEKNKENDNLNRSKDNDNIKENKESLNKEIEEPKNELSINNENIDNYQEKKENIQIEENNKIKEEDKEKEEKKEYNKNENEDEILDKKEEAEFINEDKLLNENKEESNIKKDEEKKEEEYILKKTEEDFEKKDEDEKNNNDSEHIIDSIIQNELNDIPKEKGKREDNKEGKNTKKYITLNDLENDPFKKMKINSPRSLQIIHDNGYKEEELYYNPKKLVDNFYEKLRLDKIKKLNDIRNKLIQEENLENNENNDELIKNLILSTQEKILDDNLERIKTRNDIELANIVKYELDKNLSKLELKKNANNYKKEKLELKPYEIMLNKKKKNAKNNRYKTLENKTPIITNMKSQNENLRSFYMGQKQNEYCLYNQKLNQKLEKVELLKLKRNELFKLKKNMETERARINLKKSEDKLNLKMANLKKKMEWKDFMTIVIKNVIKKDKMEKIELNNQKSLMKKEYINNLKNNEKKERDKKMELIIKKGERSNNIKNNMRRIYSSRMDKYNNMKKERIKNISKIQRTLKNGEGENEKNLDRLMEEFPDNYRISEVIKDYQLKKNEIENNKKIRIFSPISNLYNTNKSNAFNLNTITSNNNFNTNKSYERKRIFLYSSKKKKENNKKNEKIKKEERRINNINSMNESIKIKNEEQKDEINDIYNENELKDKIRTFKLQLYKNFLNKVKEEKNKEMMRKKQLEMINDITLRNNLEIQFSDERALIDMRLRKENENLRKIAKEYETKLKNNFLKKQDRILNLVKEINDKKENKN